MDTVFTDFNICNQPVTIVLAAIIFIGSLAGLANRKLMLKAILHPYSIKQENEYYRLITSDLVHNDIWHLILNEVMLITFCGSLEGFLNQHSKTGSLKFFMIYLVSSLTGSILTTIHNRKNFGFISSGTSGSIMGCVFSYTILNPHEVAFYLPGIGGVENIFGALIFTLALITYKLKNKNSVINHEIHFYGAIGGILATIVLFPNVL